MGLVVVNKENFETEVLKSNKRVIADFNANWCGPCKMLKPIIDEVADEIDSVKFVSINIDEEEELAYKYAVMSIPCLVVFENGVEVNRSIGLIQKDQIKELAGVK